MTSPIMSEFAPAKVNLCLHVTGQRADGYHLLDSLVAFAEVGDQLHGVPAGDWSLSLDGPFGALLPADLDNLVLKAARLHAPASPVAFTLEKHLPPASGIGGGSADAAAAVRLMQRLLARIGDTAPWDEVALARLGADIPVCLRSRPIRMRGIGERLDAIPTLPKAWLVLANPRVEVPTPSVFKALASKTHAPLPEVLPQWRDIRSLAAWLKLQRNDLEAPARSLAPQIGTVLELLAAQQGQLLSRMSGSGATCFALFETEVEATKAAASVQAAQPEWWVAAAALRG